MEHVNSSENHKNAAVSERIFISYRWQDNPDDKYFDRFVRSVEEITGLNAAWDKEFLGSGNFKHAIAGKVASCIVFMPIVTEQYLAFGTLGGRENDNDYCLFELAKAIVEGRKIVPILSYMGGNIQTPSEEEAMSAAERVLSASCTNDDLRILQKHLLAQNGVPIDPQYETREDQLRTKGESLSALIFDTFCKSGDIPYYKQFLERQAERLNPVRILDNYSSRGLTLENSYVPKTFQRHLTEAERKEKEKQSESAAPSDIDETGLLEKLASERFSVITGDAGQGKSSFARHACIRLAKSAAQNGLSKDALFPLYFECKNIYSKSLNRRADFLNELAEDSLLPRPAIEALLRHGRALFIFDAMDEVSPSQMDKLLEAIHSHLILEKGWSFRILFTTRPGQKLVSGGGDMTIDHSQSTVVRRYSVKPFDERQRDEYVRKLAPALREDEGLGDELIAALDKKESEFPDYGRISRNPFILFALFYTYRSGAELPETRFDAIVSVMDNMIKRDIEKKACNHLAVKNVKTVLGAAAYRFYRARDEGRRPQVSTDTLLEIAESLYNLDETSSSGSEKIDEYKTLFGAGGLFDESGFRHEFLAATYAAYYLLFLMKKRKSDGNSPIDETEAAALRSGTDYWNSVTEALLCLLDSTSEYSNTYLEPLLEELQKADTPEYDTLCGAVSQFKRNRARSASSLLSTMLERGCDGLESGGLNNKKFICKMGENPYEELFYYPAVYPALRDFLPNLATAGGSAEREYLRGELIKEVCALFSENEWEGLQSVYAARVGSAYPESVRKMEKAAYRRAKPLKGFVRIPDGETKIGNFDFYSCAGLTSITIPSSVTKISDWAFSGCTGLASISIPSSVTVIGGSAFYGCTGLTNIIIPSSVTEIGSSAFEGCIGLTSITIQEGVTVIGDSAFSGCTGLGSIKVDAANSRYHSENNCLVETRSKTLIAACKSSIIPADGSVTVIGDSAFSGCTGLTSITIPGSVTEIGRSAFSGCTGLTSITIPGSVTEIGRSAFSGCIGLTSISIPSSVTKIGRSAFSHCTGLTSISIPSSVTEIGMSAFEGCSGLTSISIPSSVTEIGKEAFYGCSGLTSIIIPDSVTKIGEWAFSGCTGLTSISIPSSVTKIGEWAFFGCTGLTSISIPSSVTEIGIRAFYGCTGLEAINVDAANSIYHSENNCLIETESETLIAGCKSSIIPADGSVTEIGDSAFKGCTGLTSISIPSSVTEIGDEAFSGCTRLEAINVDAANSIYHSVNNCLIETEYKTLIAGCKSSIIPADGSVTNIGSFAFDGCTGLTSISIPSSVAKIGNSAFSGCSGLSSISIPRGVTEIGSGAFSLCSGLSSISIPRGVTEIGSGAFSLCTGLASISIPDSVTKIGSWAFSGCIGLTSFSIPNSVTKIGDSAFSHCTGLTSITIPDSVTVIGGWAFYGCTGLTSFSIPSSVTEIGSLAFERCTGLTSVTIQEGVTEIGKEAFKGCTGLTSITIPDSVTEIGIGAFEGCISITSISIPDSVTEIYGFLFADCTNLTSIAIPSSVTKIGVLAFKGCTGLTSITIPSSVTRIEWYAFHGCTWLKTVYYTGSEDEWNRVKIDDGNNPLTDAEIVFNYRE